MKSLGQIAYEAYFDSLKGLWLECERLPKWEEHPSAVQRAWEAAALAVQIVKALPVIEVSE